MQLALLPSVSLWKYCTKPLVSCNGGGPLARVFLDSHYRFDEQLALVVVSHDREFLDRVCTKIVETEFGVTYSYTGNYRSYLKQKQANALSAALAPRSHRRNALCTATQRKPSQERVALAMSAWEAQQKEIKGLRADISKLRRTSR